MQIESLNGESTWEEIAGELIARGIACVIPSEDIQRCRARMGHLGWSSPTVR